MTKYKEYYQKMISNNEKLFKSFEEVHAAYDLQPTKWQAEFNQLGEQVLELVREYENRLCGRSEGGGYAQYSSRLAEKFQAEVKKHFPKIDFVGVTVSKPFTLRKIFFS